MASNTEIPAAPESDEAQDAALIEETLAAAAPPSDAPSSASEPGAAPEPDRKSVV